MNNDLCRRVRARTAEWQARLLAQCLTTTEAADLLGLPVARVRHMLRRRELVATKAFGRWHILPWQFDGPRLVPKMPVVAQAIPPDLSFLAAANWVSLPNSDLEVNGEPVSPLEWLRSGGDAELAAELARAL